MTIFNKDGKVYILKGPNPLVEKQVSWDPSKLIFHNFDWNEVKIKNNSSSVPKIKTDIDVKEKKIPNPEPSIPIVTSPTIDKKEEEADDQTQTQPKPPSEPEKSFDLPYIKYKVLSYCLPAKVEHRVDKLYGESWGRIKYDNKIIFPLVMINSTDFAIEFWTSDPKEQITNNSIIYPFSYEVHNQETNNYDRVPFDEYRWWKVTEKEKKQEGGWLFKAIPSEIQPDFS